MNPSGSSVYPMHPPGTRTLVKVSGSELTAWDRILVAGSSLFMVGSVLWVPACYFWAWKKWKKIPKEDKRRRTLYTALIFALTGILAYGPQHSRRAGEFLSVRKWSIWSAWLKFIAMEVVADQPLATNLNLLKDKAIFAFVPHGIFPFPFAFAVLPELAQQAFGIFRPVVATATTLLPVVRDIIAWVNPV
jgi:hypothetical protein